MLSGAVSRVLAKFKKPSRCTPRLDPDSSEEDDFAPVRRKRRDENEAGSSNSKRRYVD